jgi:hypothetical protein
VSTLHAQAKEAYAVCGYIPAGLVMLLEACGINVPELERNLENEK